MEDTTNKIFYIVNLEGIIFRDDKYLMITRSKHDVYMPGALSFPGGKVENATNQENILESTLRREILEETGVQVCDELIYLESHVFTIPSNDISVVDIVFLGRFKQDTNMISTPEETEDVHWLTYAEIITHGIPSWTKKSLDLAEAKRHLLERSS